MSNEGEATMAADAIPDFPDLYPRQVSFNEYMVLHLSADDPNTAYMVDISAPDCDCPDFAMNRDDGQVCKHLAAALFEATKHKSMDQEAHRILSQEVRTFQQAVRDAEQTLTAVQADGMTDGSSSGDDGADGAEQDIEANPVAALKGVLQDEGITPGNVNAWVDEDYGSLQFEADDMDDDEFDTFRDWCQANDLVNWDRDNRRNYIKPDDLAEALGSV